MSSPNKGNYQRLSRELFALAKDAKTLVSPLGLSDLLDAVMKKIPGVIEAAEIGLVVLWDQSSIFAFRLCSETSWFLH